MAFINGYGQGVWGISPWGDPTQFDSTTVAATPKNAAQIAIAASNTDSQITDAMNNTSSGITVKQVNT